MESMEAKVIILEDNYRVRDSLKAVFKLYHINTITFSSAQSFLDHKDSFSGPSCLLSGFYLNDMTGLELLRMLASSEHFMATVFYAEQVSIETSVMAIRAGAVDFLKMPFAHDSLLNTVQRAFYQDINLKKRLQDARYAQARFERLTPRERDIFNCVVTGLLNKQIAWELGICEKTVKVHRAQVMKKTEVKSFADLVRLSENLKSAANVATANQHYTHSLR